MKPSFKWYYVLMAIPLYVIALLPMPIIYGLSDLLRFIFYTLFSYRKDVVLTNLRNSFPEKDEKWIKVTAFKFYQNLFDVTLETITIAVRSRAYYKSHIRYDNMDLMNSFKERNQPFILVCGHIANWEWAGQGLHQQGIQVDVLYHPLSSKFFDWFMYAIRNRYGVYPITMQNTMREMIARKSIPSAITFIADQTPSSTGCHWMEFLNQDTPVFLGVEKMAKKLNYPVVYGEMHRLKRGYYEVQFELLFAEPKLTKDFEITEAHTRLLEKCIRNYPESWLWSHRRWKHKRPVENKIT
jgi:KDO2-lipid IV(A) lauroyltransferase